MTEKKKSTKVWIIAIWLLLVLLFGYFLYVRYMKEEPAPVHPAPDEPPSPPIVMATEIDSMEDIAEINAERPIPEPDEIRSVDRLQWHEHGRGDVNAPLAIVEYASLSGKLAGMLHPKLQALQEENPDVRWIYRHFPDANREIEYIAAYAAECVHNQWSNGDFLKHEGFWEYIDTLYAEGFRDKRDLISLAPDWADTDELERCIDDRDTEEAVKDDKLTGLLDGDVEIVPTFFIVNTETMETRVVDGADTMEFFQRILDAMREA